MEKTLEKSEEQAAIIKVMASLILHLDIEYCREAAKDMVHQANRQDAMLILNPGHNPKRNDLLALKGKALSQLCDYVESLQEIDALQEKIGLEDQQRSEINKLFL